MSKFLNSTLPDHKKVQQYYALLKRKIKVQGSNMPAMSKTQEEAPLKKEPKKQVIMDEPKIVIMTPH